MAWIVIAGLLGLAYLSLWQPATWVYNDRSLVDPQITRLWSGRVLERATWAMTPTPASARLVNLLVHGLNGVLVGLLFRRVGLPEWAATAGAAAWVLHPLHVESVAYAAGRADVLAATGVLIATLAAAAGGRAWGAWTVLGLGLGMAAKETAVVVLGLVPLVRALAGHRWRLSAGVCAGVAVAGVAWLGGPRAVVNVELYSSQTTWATWLLLQSSAAVRLIAQTVVPVGQSIDVDYDILPRLTGVLSGTALLACAAAAWHWRRAAPLVAGGLAWMLMALAPRLLVQTPRSYLNEHQFYVSLVGLALVIACGGEALDRRWGEMSWWKRRAT